MFRPLLVFFLILTGGAAQPLHAQDERAPLRLEVLDRGEVVVQLGDILADPDLGEALESGLPLRLEVVTQLWSDGFFDSQVDQSRWQANVFYDALEDAYVLGEGGNEEAGEGGTARRFGSLQELRQALPRMLEPSLSPDEEGRYYYLARLSVETLSLSDLEELRRWLRGDLAPAISGDGDVGSAAERGLRRTVIRLLGMPTRRFDARTPTFDHGTEGDR